MKVCPPCDQLLDVAQQPIAIAASNGLRVFSTPKHSTKSLRIAATTICLGSVLSSSPDAAQAPIRDPTLHASCGAMGPALAALGRDDRDSSAALVGFLIRDGIAVAAAVRASDPIAAGRIDQYRGRAAVDAERPDLLRIVAARGQLGDDGVVDQSFEVEIVEAGAVRPER